MTFTKSPEYNTHTLKRVPVALDNKYDPEGYFFYPAFTNLFPTIENKEVVLTKRAPINVVEAFSGTEPRGMAFDPNTNYLYVVYDNNLKVYTSTNAFSLASTTTSGAFTTTQGSVAFTTYRVGIYVQLIAFEPKGTEAKVHYWDSGNAAGPSGTVTIPVANMARTITSMDGYIFTAGGDGESGQRIYNSTIGSPATWNISTDFVDAEMEGDVIYALAKHRNHIVAFGKETIEFFYNAANENGSPLTRQAAYSQKMGITAYAASGPLLQQVEDDLYFVGGQAGSPTGVFKISNFKIEKVSDLFVDSVLRSNNSLDGRIGVYEHQGTPCVALFFSGIAGALVYKEDTKAWIHVTKSGVFDYSVFGTYSNEGGVYILGHDAGVITLYKSGTRGAGALTQAPSEVIVASYITDNIDFDSNNQKHIKWVDVCGWFGNNSVSLFYSNSLQNNPSPYISCGAKYQNSITSKNPLRWRNLGRTRGQKYSVYFSGTNDIKYKGLEIAVNQGTY